MLIPLGSPLVSRLASVLGLALSVTLATPENSVAAMPAEACRSLIGQKGDPERIIMLARQLITIQELDLFETVVWEIDPASHSYVLRALRRGAIPVIQTTDATLTLICRLSQDIYLSNFLSDLPQGKTESERIEGFLRLSGWSQCLEEYYRTDACELLRGDDAVLSRLPSQARQQWEHDREEHQHGMAVVVTGALSFMLMHEFGHHALGHTSRPSPVEVARAEQDADDFAMERLLGTQDVALMGVSYPLQRSIFLEHFQPTPISPGVSPNVQQLHEDAQCRANRAFQIDSKLLRLRFPAAAFIDALRSPDGGNTLATAAGRRALEQWQDELDALPPDGAQQLSETDPNCRAPSNFSISELIQDYRRLHGYATAMLRQIEGDNLIEAISLAFSPEYSAKTLPGQRLKLRFFGSMARWFADAHKGDVAPLYNAMLDTLDAADPITAGRVLEPIGVSRLIKGRTGAPAERIEAAEAILRCAVRYNPYLAEALINLSFIALSKRRFSEADAFAQRVLTVSAPGKSREFAEEHINVIRTYDHATLHRIGTDYVGAEIAFDQSRCPRLLEIHSFLSRAQSRCGFTHYSEEMRTTAHSCSQLLGEAEVDAQLSAGIEKFDYNERERGLTTICDDVANDFKQWLQR